MGVGPSASDCCVDHLSAKRSNSFTDSTHAAPRWGSDLSRYPRDERSLLGSSLQRCDPTLDFLKQLSGQLRVSYLSGKSLAVAPHPG